MLYFREKEKELLQSFSDSTVDKAMAVYGRRRAGKTALIMDFYHSREETCIYYQCASFDYSSCLKDFIESVRFLDPDFLHMDHFGSFREVFSYLSRIGISGKIFIIDEFPFLAKKNENAVVEFQWIIDHALSGNKLILLGSSLSFMKGQIGDREAPLYGRFDKIIEVLPFSFAEVQILFPRFEDAVEVYAKTGGVAQYVLFYKEFRSVRAADAALFFSTNGRLFKESENLLQQELRDVSTYVSILRAIGTFGKDSGQIAAKCGMEQRAVFGYLKKLVDLGILSLYDNPLSDKKNSNRYYISDTLFRFTYAFIAPNVSMITTLQDKAMSYVMGDRYSEYLGFIYEDIIREKCYIYGMDGTFPFVPVTVGRWWGKVCESGLWKDSEVDIVAFDQHNIVIGECKYKNKAVGLKELEELKLKAQFMPTGTRTVSFLLASRSGFTDDLKALQDPNLILIEKT